MQRTHGQKSALLFFFFRPLFCRHPIQSSLDYTLLFDVVVVVVVVVVCRRIKCRLQTPKVLSTAIRILNLNSHTKFEFLNRYCLLLLLLLARLPRRRISIRSQRAHNTQIYMQPCEWANGAEIVGKENTRRAQERVVHLWRIWKAACAPQLFGIFGMTCCRRRRFLFFFFFRHHSHRQHRHLICVSCVVNFLAKCAISFNHRIFKSTWKSIENSQIMEI